MTNTLKKCLLSIAPLPESRLWLEILRSNPGLRIVESLIALLISLGTFSGIAQATTQQVTVNIDGTPVATFSELMAQAEVLAEMTIAQQFQADPNLTEIQVVVLGERRGQLVSLLSSRLTRDTWQRGADLRTSTRYFTTASTLLGYAGSSQVAQRRSSTSGRSLARNDIDPRQTVGEALRSGRISDSEYWDLMDALD